MDRIITSWHHINAKSIGGSSHPDNIVEIEHRTHQKLHTLLGTMPFHKQIEFLEAIAKTALKKAFRDDLEAVLQDHAGNYYKDHTFRKVNGIYVPKSS